MATQLIEFLAAERAKLREATADRVAAFEAAGDEAQQQQQQQRRSCSSNEAATGAVVSVNGAAAAGGAGGGERTHAERKDLVNGVQGTGVGAAAAAAAGGGGGAAVDNFQRKVTPKEHLALTADLFEGPSGAALAAAAGGGAGGLQLESAFGPVAGALDELQPGTGGVGGKQGWDRSISISTECLNIKLASRILAYAHNIGLRSCVKSQ